jgi:Zn-dependent peptidase ImmA (M78 family)
MATRRTSSLPEISRARSAATLLLSELRVRAPSEIDVELIAAHRGLTPIYKQLKNEEGHLVRGSDVGFIVVNRRFEGTPKARFVIAHELGHYVQHPGVDQFELCTDSDLHAWYQTSGAEPEANAFAAELLMPSVFFVPKCNKINKPNLHHVRELAEIFQTSLTATALRLIECSGEPCAVVYSVDGKIAWSMSNAEFSFKPDRPETMEGSMWPGGIDIDLQEHSIKMSNHNAVLTLLWHAYQG